MIEAYLKRFVECRTINEVNHVHIAMTNLMTPREAVLLLKEITRHAGSFLPRNVDADKAKVLRSTAVGNITRAARDVVGTGKATAEPYGRRALAKGLHVFSDGTGRAAKTLLIGFSGNAERLMMPTPIILQNIDAASVDVAVLRDLRKAGYRDGLEGIGDSLEALIDALPDLLAFSDYRRVATLGTSGGALPALLAGLRLRADAAMSVGGNGPDDPRWQRPDGIGARELIAAYAGSHSRTRVALVHGAQSPRDQAAAEAIAALVAATLVPVSDPAGPVGHGALYPLVGQRRLAAFLKEHLGL